MDATSEVAGRYLEGNRRRWGDPAPSTVVMQPGLPGELPEHWELDAGPGIEPAVATSVRRVHRWGAPERVHHLVPSEPGVVALRQAAADGPGVAGAAAGTPDPGTATGRPTAHQPSATA